SGTSSSPCGRCGAGPSRSASPVTTCSPSGPRAVPRTRPPSAAPPHAPAASASGPCRSTSLPAAPSAAPPVAPVSRCAAASPPGRRPLTSRPSVLLTAVSNDYGQTWTSNFTVGSQTRAALLATVPIGNLDSWVPVLNDDNNGEFGGFVPTGEGQVNG